MSHLGYALESEIEDFFLEMTSQTKKDPILAADRNGLIRLNRTFRIPTSGAMDSMAGDVMTAISWLPKQLKVECKSRLMKNKKDGQIIVVEKKWIDKNNEEALKDNQIPLLVFSFKRVKKDRLWWLIKEQDWRFLFYGEERVKDLSRPVVECKTGQENKKKDKLKFVYSKLIDISKESTQLIFIDHKAYYLVRHENFKTRLFNVKEKVCTESRPNSQNTY